MLTERGVEVTVIAPRDRTFEPLIAMGCRCVELPVASKGTNPREDLRTLVALYREYRAIASARRLSLHDQAEYLRLDRGVARRRAVDRGDDRARLRLHPAEPHGA